MAAGDALNARWQNVAIVALTRTGTRHARYLWSRAPGAVLYVSEAMADPADPPGVRAYGEPMSDLLPRLYAEGRPLVVFAAAGLVVRLLAPLLRDKHRELGVVVIDEQGTYAVSLLSGHGGGANALARAAAQILGGEAVITTASDTLPFPALDRLGEEAGWTLEEAGGMTQALAALVNGEPVLICQEAGHAPWDAPGWTGEWPPHVQWVRALQGQEVKAYAALMLITDRLVAEHEVAGRPWILYRPPTLAIGIGCERGVSEEAIDEAVRSCLVRHHLAFLSLSTVGTLDRKLDEPGLQAFAQRHGLSLQPYPAHVLERAGSGTPSLMVKRHVGTPAVAEPAARLACRGGVLVAPKMKHGRVTVAVARHAGVMQQAGRLMLVGLGPGDRADVTPRAMAALAGADVVVGYRRYLESINDLVKGKTIVSGELGQERARAERAVQLAGEGRHVVVVSSGDIGIYGMAGLVFEQLASEGWDPFTGIPVHVIPGVTALSSCAALLGAPLMHDFAAVSLSDLHTPWSVIAKRIEGAAQAGFVVALYNPKSGQRTWQLAEACRVLLRYRPGDTPVGLVTRAGRPGSRTRVITLRQLAEHEFEAVDMETTVLVGNPMTFRLGDRMVTPRANRPLGAAERHSGTCQDAPA